MPYATAVTTSCFTSTPSLPITLFDGLFYPEAMLYNRDSKQKRGGASGPMSEVWQPESVVFDRHSALPRVRDVHDNALRRGRTQQRRLRGSGTTISLGGG